MLLKTEWFSVEVSQQSVACSLEILSRLLAQTCLLKSRLWFVSVWAPGLWEFPKTNLQTGVSSASWEQARKESGFISSSPGAAATAALQAQEPAARNKL